MRGFESSGILAPGDLGSQYKRASSSTVEALERSEGRISEWHSSSGTRAVPHPTTNVSLNADMFH